MNIKLIVILIVVAVMGFFLFKDKLPITSTPSGQSSQKQDIESMTVEKVLALGGTCFKDGFKDETKDVEAVPDGQGRTKAPDKDSYDVKRIGVGVRGNMLVSVWEFVGIFPANSDHINIDLITYHNKNDRVFVSKYVSDGKWKGSFKPEKGNYKDFDPQVNSSGNLVQFITPLEYVSASGVVDALNFESRFYEKPIQTMFVDYISEASYQPFSCPN